MPMPANYRPIAIRRGPLFAGEHTGAFYIDLDEVERIRETGPPWKFHDAWLIDQVIEFPGVVFEGLSREGYEDGYCYCCAQYRLSWQYSYANEDLTENMVFLVFVKKEKGLAVFDWEWRMEAQGGEAEHPVNWRIDFGRPVWTPT